jgi:hypothetical protein
MGEPPYLIKMSAWIGGFYQKKDLKLIDFELVMLAMRFSSAKQSGTQV